MGSALSGMATIGTGVANAGQKAWAADEDYRDEYRVLTHNAIQAGERGRLEGGRIRRAGAQLAAQQKVAYATSGVALDTGTPASVIASTGVLAEQDAAMAEFNAAAEVWGYKQMRSQAYKNLQRKLQGAGNDAIGSALSGSAQILSSGGGGFGGG